ncbi:peptidoglycan-binding protein [Geoanaerobacter pelophilus]|uniref:Peptidoglycan-associated protein n=1 Tax=Geoanaerobacter pelophilus TaxID=60036 RepID=A0ABQ0ME88_9BACT|nr:peptidoglycan-binding protein [Geoanaerobacter pelophilus]
MATGPGAAAARNVAAETAAASGEDEKIAFDGAPEGAAKIPSELKRIHFDFDSYLLPPEARDTLASNAEVLTEGPQVKVRIAGHCDERGSDEYNLALSDKRARAAQEYLVGLGVPRERLSVIGYGKERPLAPGHDEASWAQNRRDEFEMTP